MEKKYDLCERLFKFSVDVILYMRTVKNSVESMDIKRQLIKAATSSGANYEESQGSPTKPDFKTKVGISLKEMREANYFLRIFNAINSGDAKKSEYLVKESTELKNILGSILKKISSFLLLFTFYLSPFTFYLLPSSTFAYTDNYPIGARSFAMGNASVTLSDMWSVHHNQAGLAFQKNIGGGIYYESKFFVPELGLKGGVAVVPTGSGVFGLDISSFGYSKYNENKLGIAYGRTFGEFFSAGIQLDYLRTQIAENYGSKGVIAGEAGVQAKLTKNLILGAHIFNLNRAKSAPYNNETIPTIMRAGASYSFSDKVILCIETEKDIDFKPNIKFGMEYHVIEVLFIRAGTSTYPFINSFGAGVLLKNFQLDAAASVHPVLGYSSQVSLSYLMGKEISPGKKTKASTR